MSNEKINIQEIVDLVSVKLTISKKQIEEFFRVFLPLIEESLIAGEPVKIKNFGTLKVQWNNPRKSVNVNTGEEIILEGYNKIVFVPDESLKELVNEPYAHLFPVFLDDSQNAEIPESGPLRIINEQALEIKSILSEIKQLNIRNTEKPVSENIDINSDELELIEVDHEESITSILNEETLVDYSESEKHPLPDHLDLLPIVDTAESAENNTDLPLENETEQTEVEIEETIISDDDLTEKEITTKRTADISELITAKQEIVGNKKRDKAVWWLSGTVLIMIASVILYFFNLNFYRFVNNTFSSIVQTKKAIPDATVLSPDSVIISDIDSAKIKENLFYENLLKKNREYVDVITMERSKKGTSLRQLSEKYYGHPSFWIYIYEANIAEISDSTVIKQGKMLKIPVVDSLLTDTNNVRSFEIAQNLTRELFLKQVENVETNRAEQSKTETEPQIIHEKPVKTKMELLATETMEVGSRLTLFARKYYGSKDFWVYIYEANMDVIKNPDNVPVGTMIKIPKLDRKSIDLNNPECINKAKELQVKYLKK